MAYLKAIWDRILQSTYRTGLSQSNTTQHMPPPEDADVPPKHEDRHTTHKGGWRKHGGGRH